MKKIIAVWLCTILVMSIIGTIVPTTANPSKSRVNSPLYTSHSPIYIDGNADFTPVNGVTSGSGTQSDPYIIEGWDITALSATGIRIGNTDAYFIIGDCYVHDGRANWKNGIYFTNVRNGQIENTISTNNYYGIHLYSSRYNNILNGSASNNWIGIYLCCSSRNNIYNNSISNNLEGFLITRSRYNAVYNNSISNNYYGFYQCYKSYNSDIYNNIVLNNDYGILLRKSHYNNIYNNIVLNNDYGIHLYDYSYLNNIYNNIASNNDYGIYISRSRYNNIYNNIANSNKNGGIYLFFSRYNTLVNNTLENNGITIWGRTIDYYNTHSIDTTNTANGKPIYYYTNEKDINIDGWSAGQIILVNCMNFAIKNVDCSNATIGVQLAYCDDCSIENSIFNNEKYGIYLLHSSCDNVSNNSASNNDYGIRLEYSKNNNIYNNSINSNNKDGIFMDGTSCNNIYNNSVSNSYYYAIHLHYLDNNNNIYNNNFLNNYYGIYCYWYPYNNRIYHNNFIDNINQAHSFGVHQWDDGYPSGGNYWSDYSGIDLYSGPNQNISGSDGIGDTPYIIKVKGNVRDNYPLMYPRGEPKISVEKEFISSEITTISQGVISAINITNIGVVDITSMNITDEYIENMAPNDSPEILVTITSHEDEVYAIMPENLTVATTDSDITISFELPLEVVPIFWENGTLQFGEELYYLESIPKDWVVGVQYLLHPITELEIGIYTADATITAYSKAGASTTETATGTLTVSEPIELEWNLP